MKALAYVIGIGAPMHMLLWFALRQRRRPLD